MTITVTGTTTNIGDGSVIVNLLGQSYQATVSESGAYQCAIPDDGYVNASDTLTLSVTATNDGGAVTETVTITKAQYGTSSVFSCSAMYPTLVINNGNPVNAGSGAVPIEIDNISNEGTQQQNIISGLKASIGSEPAFQGQTGSWPTNNYLWTPPSYLEVDTELEFEYSGCVFPGGTVFAGGSAPPAAEGLPPGFGQYYGPYPAASPSDSRSIPFQSYTRPSAGNTVVVSSGNRVGKIATTRSPYSRRACELVPGFNGNDTLIMTAFGTLYSKKTGASVASVSGNQKVISFTNPAKVFMTAGSKLRQYIHGQGSSDVHDFAQHGAGTNLKHGESEGSPSVDDDKHLLTSNDMFYSYSLSQGYLGRRTNAQIKADAANAGVVNPADVDAGSFSKLGKYIVMLLAGNNGCYVRYNPDWSNPVVLGNTRGGNFYKVRGQHACHFIGKNGEDLLLSDHWDKAVVVDLDDPTVVYGLECAGGGHYSGAAILRGGYVVYSKNYGNGLVEGLTFDKADYSGSVESSQDRDYIGYWLPPTTPNKREFWCYSQYSSSVYPGTTATVNQYGNRVYFNTATQNDLSDISMMYCEPG